MAHSYKYAIAQFPTNSLRDERLNIALVIFSDETCEVKIPRSLDKIRAISAAVDLDATRSALEQIPELDRFVKSQGAVTADERLNAIANIAAVKFSSLGEFFAASASLYDRTTNLLISKLIEPEPAPLRENRVRATRLLSDVKLAFKAERVLAHKGEGLETHRIIANHKLAEGLPADLILKNGAMHVIQTVDASSEEIYARRTIASIAVSALVFEQARMNFGELETKSRLVYKATSAHESLIAPSLAAAEHQGATLINWESRDDRNRFIIELSSLAEPTPLKGNKATPVNIHASLQKTLRLN